METAPTEERSAEYSVRDGNVHCVPQHAVTEFIQDGKMGSFREVAWFWNKEDANEYAHWKSQRSSS